MVKRITNNFGFPNKLVCVGAADILVTKINGGMMIEKTTADNKLGIFGWTQGCHISIKHCGYGYMENNTITDGGRCSTATRKANAT